MLRKMHIQWRDALKLAISMVLFYWLALWMDWDMPKYGGLAIVLISLGSAEASLRKGVLRIVGTTVGLAVGLLFLACFSQDRWSNMVFQAGYLFVVSYFMTGSRNKYAWYVAGFIPSLVWSTTYMNVDAAFHYAIFRYLETTAGIVVYMVVCLLLFVRRSPEGATPVVTEAGPTRSQRLVKSTFAPMCFIIAYLTWIRINPPAGPSMVYFAGTVGLTLLLTPMNAISLLSMLLISVVFFVAPVYFLIMPHLPSGTGLLVVIFIYSFVFAALGSRWPLMKLIPLVTFVVLTGISNHQSYSFSAIVDGAMMMGLGLTVVALVQAIFFPVESPHWIPRRSGGASVPAGGRAGVTALVVLGICLTGCKVGPNYDEPVASVNEQWLEMNAPQVSGQDVEVQWWKGFNDPLLNELIEEAYAQDLTLQQAAVRVMQAMAARGIAIGELFPQTQEMNGSYSRTRFSETTSAPSAYVSSWTLGFDAAWELDVWGKYRRNIESLNADLDASLANYDNVMVALVSEVAIAYVNIRTLQARIAIAQDNVRIQEGSLAMAESRFRNGATSELDVAQATAALEETRSDVPSLASQLKQEVYRLDVLLGSPPRDLLARLGDDGEIPTVPETVAVGIPADLLRRRPDIRLAERQAAALSAQVGVAESLLYPSFYLSGSLGLQSSRSSDLFDIDSWTGSMMPGFSWPILNYGRLRNNVRVQDAAFQAAILNYQYTVLVAAQEVESALAGFDGAQEQAYHLAKSVEASERSFELSMIQYREGASTFTRVLDSQMQLRQSQEALVIAQGQTVGNLIATYKALGGGWQTFHGPLLPDEIRAEMEARTDWGDRLSPENTPRRPIFDEVIPETQEGVE